MATKTLNRSQRSTDEPVRFWAPLAIAVFMGSVAGFFHVGTVLFRRHVSEEFTWTSRDIVWMSPLGTILAVGAAAVPLALILIIWRRRRIERAAIAVTGALAALFAFLAIRGLHPLAVLALATGAGVFLSGLRWRAMTLASGAAAGLLAIAIAFGLAQASQREKSPGELLENMAGRPSVLVLILDTVRAASTSLHGYHRATTPQIDSLSGEGVVFDLAIAPSSWTLPSHGAMFTGVHGSRLSTSWRKPLDAAHPTIAEVLRDRGYATGAFVGNYFYTHHESGVGRGFNVLRDFKRTPAQILWSTTLGQTPFINSIIWDRTPRALVDAIRSFDLRVRAEPLNDRRRTREIIDEFLTWEQRRASRPFFAFLNLYDAHDPYDPPAHVRTRFASDPTPQDRYDSGIGYMDDELGRLFGVMRERGVLDNTLVVISSDHGEQWGEHGLKNHGNSLFMPAVHVPLVLRFPARIPGGTRVRQPVSLTDLAATIVDVVGLDASPMPGESLLHACCDADAQYSSVVISETEQLDPSSRSRAPASRGPLASIFVDSLQFIRNGDGSFQLFDLSRDPTGVADALAGDAACAAGARLDASLRALAVLPATPPMSEPRCRARRETPAAAGSH